VHESTADRFIAVMAKIKAIDPSLDEPMRHQMRALKETAIRLIDNAIREAEQLAWLAGDMSETCGKAIDEELKNAASTNLSEQ
jgi:hypothetical protein